MRKLLQALKPIDEFVIVVGAAFGPFIAFTIDLIIQGAPPYYHIRDDEIVRLLIYEVIGLLILGSFLATRGWTLERMGLGPNLKETLLGVGLFIVVDALGRLGIFTAAALVPELAKAEAEMEAAKGTLSPTLMIALSVINPIWEEGLLCGYMLNALRRRSHWPVVLASIAIRTFYHYYQGPLGIISILPFGIILTLYYVRTGRLWPLIVAHILGDFVPLLEYTQK